MRVSANAEDRGFPTYKAVPKELRAKIQIFLDDREQTHVITADDHEGTVLRNVKDENGNYVIKGDEFVTETLTGRVTIILPAC